MRSTDSIDVSNRKPRRFKGTPSYRLRNIVTAAVAVYTLVAGAFYVFTPLSTNMRNTFEVLGAARLYDLENESPEEKLKKNAMIQAYRTVLHKHQPNYSEEVEKVAGD